MGKGLSKSEQVLNSFQEKTWNP